jgi:uncharacterized protein
MLAGILKSLAVVACTAMLVAHTAAWGTTSPPAEALRAPDHMADAVLDGEKRAYQQVLDTYRQARRAHPADAALVLAQCNFIDRFASAEDLPWSDVAAKDFDACQTALDSNFASDPEVALFVLEHRFGKVAIAYGEPLVGRSKDWSAAQRARLHASLSRSYAFTKDERRAGEEAVLATKLDPGNERLIDAMRFLVRTGRAQEAGALLAAAPVPKMFWQEAGRIRAATDLLPGGEARDELHRAQRAGLTIDSYTTARALQHAGDAAGAEAALMADAASHRIDTPQNQQLRLDVAFDAGDVNAAANLLHDQYVKTGNAVPLTYAYAHLVDLHPAIVGRIDLFPLALHLLVFLALLAVSPGVILFPAHYRGTVRQRAGQLSGFLFERIGLRHAWFALSIFLVALYLVAMFRQGGGASLSSTGSGVVRMDWQNRIAVTYLWTLSCSALGLVWVGRLLGWREWTGSGRWKPVWFLLPAVLLAFGWLGMLALSRHGAPPVVTSPTWSTALVHGARSLGGLPLALLVVAGLVPVIEELVFRGCLLGGLSRHLSFGWANAIQAALFAALHQDPRHLPYLFALGAIAGWLARRTKGLSMPIALHALNNAIFVLTMAS